MIDGIYNRKEAGAGIEPANSGFADRDLTTWLPRRLRRTETNASAWSVKSVQFGVGRSRMGVRRCPTLVSLNARSLQLSRTAQRRIPGGVNSPVRAFRHVEAEPFFVERAQGAKVWDVDGNEYIDYVGSWGPAILGHAPSVTINAVCEAAARGLSFGIPNPLEVEAVLLEPIPANAGLYFPRQDFLAILREECTKQGALLIFDEVMTGFRVARGGAQEIYGVAPDLSALGKVIGGGLPVGAFGGKAEIMDQLSPDGPVYQAGTLSGNPLAMAAGLAQLG